MINEDTLEKIEENRKRMSEVNQVDFDLICDDCKGEER